MVGISAQVVAARADLAQKQANASRVASLVGSGHAADASQVVASPLIVQLRTQEADLIRQESDYATKYGPKHPKMIAAEQQRRDLETKINEEVTRIAGAMQNDVAVARAQLGSLEGSLRGTEKQADVDNFARVKLKELEGNAESTRALYQTFLTRLRQLQDQDAIQDSDARVISRASVPLAPSSPKRMLIMAASVPAGLLLGLLIALLAEMVGAPVLLAVSSRRRPRRQPQPARAPLRPYGGAPILAQIPNAHDAHAADYIVDYPMSAFSQTMDQIAARLAMQNTRVIAVTSAQHGESKTAIAVALARAAARRGLRTVLIDADLRAPRAAQTMGIGGVKAGLYEATSGAVPLSRCLYKDSRSNALLLSTPRPLREPHMVLGSPAMSRLVAHLASTSDLVIVDTAPALSSNETPASARLADGVLMVVRQPRPEVTGAIDAMQNNGAPPIGVLLAS
jgi:Mrp family chromosome partitioning ATPase